MAYLKSLKGLPVLLSLILLSACASGPRNFHAGAAMPAPDSATLLLLPPDVVVSQLVPDTDGETEPHEEWTEQAYEGLVAGLENHFHNLGVEVVPYDGMAVEPDFLEENESLLEAVKLDMAEAKAAKAAMDPGQEYALPESLLEPLQDYDADYAFFVTLEATRVSTGRKAAAGFLAILAGALTGFVPGMSSAPVMCKVSLFDLRDGQLVYVNFGPLPVRSAAAMVEAEPDNWAKMLVRLLKDFPLN